MLLFLAASSTTAGHRSSSVRTRAVHPNFVIRLASTRVVALHRLPSFCTVCVARPVPSTQEYVPKESLDCIVDLPHIHRRHTFPVPVSMAGQPRWNRQRCPGLGASCDRCCRDFTVSCATVVSAICLKSLFLATRFDHVRVMTASQVRVFVHSIRSNLRDALRQKLWNVLC